MSESLIQFPNRRAAWSKLRLMRTSDRGFAYATPDATVAFGPRKIEAMCQKPHDYGADARLTYPLASKYVGKKAPDSVLPDGTGVWYFGDWALFVAPYNLSEGAA